MKIKINISLRQHWLLFPLLGIMVFSALYLAFYIPTSLKIGYLWIPDNFHYWLIFPYNETYLFAILAGLLFVLCGFISIFKLKEPNQVFITSPLFVSWSILSVFALCALSGFILILAAFGNVDRLDTATYKQHTLHLAYKNNNESGISYYLFDCDRSTFECSMVARFFPDNLIVWDEDARSSRLQITPNGVVTVVHNEDVIYEYSLSSK